MQEKQGLRERELEGLLGEARRQGREARDKLDALEASQHDTESKLR